MAAAAATLSEWLDALAQPAALGLGPDWLALLERAADTGAGDGFRPASVFGAPGDPISPPAPVTPAAEPETADGPDPLTAARAQAFAEGHDAGRAAAEAEYAALGARQRALRLTFRALDEAALGVLADDLAATVLALCDHVLGAAAREPAGLRARCAAAARRIGGAAGTMALQLHPDDIALLDEAEAPAAMQLVPDPALERGSVVIAGPDGSIADGPAEWRRAIAAAVRG